MNFWIILLTAVIGFAVGMLWYSQMFFGKAWMKLAGISESDMESRRKKGMGKTMLAGIVAQIVTAWVLGFMVTTFGASGFVGGVVVGFWVWLGFLATSQLGAVLWEGKAMKLYYINTFHSLVTLCLMGGILASML